MKFLVLVALVGIVAAATLKEQPQFIEEEPSTTHAPPKPYNFGFEINDDNTTNYQNRAEASDGSGGIRGSYSYVLPDHFVYTVTYEDKGDGTGLKMTVRKEPSNVEVVTPEPWIHPKQEIRQ